MVVCRVPKCECPAWKPSETSRKCANCNHGQSRHGEQPQVASIDLITGLLTPAKDVSVTQLETEESAEKALLEQCNAVEYHLVSEIGQKIDWGRRFKKLFGTIGEFIRQREGSIFETTMSEETTRESKNGNLITVKPQLMVRKATAREDPHMAWTRSVAGTLSLMKEKNGSEEQKFQWQKKYQDVMREWLVNGQGDQLVLAKGIDLPQNERIWLSGWCNQTGLLVSPVDGNYVVTRPQGSVKAAVDSLPEPPVGQFERFCRLVQDFVKDTSQDSTVISILLTRQQMGLLHMLEATGLKHHASPGSPVIISKREITEEDKQMNTNEVTEASTAELVYSRRAVDLMRSLLQAHEEGLKAAHKSALAHCMRARAPKHHSTSQSRSGRRKAAASSALLPFRQSLPAWAARPKIVDAVSEHGVVIIAGETGSGKTTQVPQFLLDDIPMLGDKSVLCTQPRRLSALSVAARVAEERGQKVGGEVGYQIRFESAVSAETRLAFVTTGVFLKILHENPRLDGYGAVVLDEVHERDRATDFAMIFLRDLLKKRSDLRVILMSATMCSDQFSSYFSTVTGTPPPIVQIEGKVYPVHTFFLEDAIQWTGTGISGPAWQASPETRQLVMQSCQGLAYSEATLDACAKFAEEPKVEGELVVDLLRFLHGRSPEGAFLVFLPGWADIKRVEELLLKDKKDRGGDLFRILCLHSHVPIQEQALAFEVRKDRKRKIVLSTNIAETSITIPDVVVVIDTGVKKEKGYDVVSGISKIEDSFVAKANAVQRRGRAGRVQEGQCFHLFPRFKWEFLDEVDPPELVRTPLEEIVLAAKLLSNADVRSLLSKAPDVPPTPAIEEAIKNLKQIGALTEDAEELTPLGRVLADMPCHPLLGSVLVWGALLRTVRPTTHIAACLQGKGLFNTTRRRGASDASRQHFIGTSHSDHYKSMRAFQAWVASGYGSAFCRERGLSIDALKNAKRSVYQFDEALSKAHLVDRSSNQNRSSWDLIRASVAAGLYPHMAQARGMLWTADKLQLAVSDTRSNLTVEQGAHEYIVYFEKCLQKSRLLMMDGTKVPPALLPILLCRSIAVDEAGETAKIVLDGWVAFTVASGTAQLLARIRKLVDWGVQVFCSQMEARLPKEDEDHLWGFQKQLEDLVEEVSRGYLPCPTGDQRTGGRKRSRSPNDGEG